MRTKVLLTFDVDFQYLWIGQFKSTTLANLSRGEFGARIGLPRILDLLQKEKIKATFFVPGKVAKLYPELILEIQSNGHEIGLHGNAHERWNDLRLDEEKNILNLGKNNLQDLLGEEIVGFRSPAWNLNHHSIDLLLEMGFKYDSSLMAGDYQPYYLRNGDKVTPDEDILFGEDSELLEIPVAWELDDFPYFAFTGRQTGLTSPKEVMDRWLEEFHYANKYSKSVLTVTMHPQVIGRGPRVEMLENFIKNIKRVDSASFCTASECLLEEWRNG